MKIDIQSKNVNIQSDDLNTSQINKKDSIKSCDQADTENENKNENKDKDYESKYNITSLTTR